MKNPSLKLILFLTLLPPFLLLGDQLKIEVYDILGDSLLCKDVTIEIPIFQYELKMFKILITGRNDSQSETHRMFCQLDRSSIQSVPSNVYSFFGDPFNVKYDLPYDVPYTIEIMLCFRVTEPGDEKYTVQIDSFLERGPDEENLRGILIFEFIPTERDINYLPGIDVDNDANTYDVPNNLPQFSYTNSTDKTISWEPAENLFHQKVVCFNVKNPQSICRNENNLKIVKTLNSRTFTNLANGDTLGFLVLGTKPEKDNKFRHLTSNIFYTKIDTCSPNYVIINKIIAVQNNTAKLTWTGVSDSLGYVDRYMVISNESEVPLHTIESKDIFGKDDSTYCFTDTLNFTNENDSRMYMIKTVDKAGNEKTGPPSGAIVYIDTLKFSSWYIAKDSLKNDMFYSKGSKNTLHLDVDNSLQITLQAVRNDTTYFENYQTEGWFFEGQINSDLADNTYTFENLGDSEEIHNETFYYRMFGKMVNDQAVHFSDTSNTVFSTQDGRPPPVITGIHAYSQTDSTLPHGGYIYIEWDPVVDSLSGLKNYLVRRKIENTDPLFVVIDSTINNFFYDTTAYEGITTAGKNIQYQIHPQDRVGNIQQFSDTITVPALIGPSIRWTFPETTTENQFELLFIDTTGTKFDLTKVSDFFLLHEIFRDSNEVIPYVDTVRHVQLLYGKYISVPFDSTGLHEIQVKMEHENYPTPVLTNKITLYKIDDSTNHIADYTEVRSDKDNSYSNILFNNFPNPFNINTTIHYQLSQISTVTIQIINVTGRTVYKKIIENQKAGNHILTWNGHSTINQSLPSGVYFINLVISQDTKVVFSQTQKMLLCK